MLDQKLEKRRQYSSLKLTNYVIICGMILTDYECVPRMAPTKTHDIRATINSKTFDLEKNFKHRSKQQQVAIVFQDHKTPAFRPPCEPIRSTETDFLFRQNQVKPSIHRPKTMFAESTSKPITSFETYTIRNQASSRRITDESSREMRSTSEQMTTGVLRDTKQLGEQIQEIWKI